MSRNEQVLDMDDARIAFVIDMYLLLFPKGIGSEPAKLEDCIYPFFKKYNIKLNKRGSNSIHDLGRALKSGRKFGGCITWDTENLEFPYIDYLYSNTYYSTIELFLDELLKSDTTKLLKHKWSHISICNNHRTGNILYRTMQHSEKFPMSSFKSSFRKSPYSVKKKMEGVVWPHENMGGYDNRVRRLKELFEHQSKLVNEYLSTLNKNPHTNSNSISTLNKNPHTNSNSISTFSRYSVSDSDSD